MHAFGKQMHSHGHKCTRLSIRLFHVVLFDLCTFHCHSCFLWPETPRHLQCSRRLFTHNHQHVVVLLTSN